ncbi:MAG: hypothetical protein M3083_06755 [Actinomycetota bacterium]|nr:hypothetical protein [Actinomycetota bacterium]
MLRHLARNLLAMLALAVVLVTIFEGSGHQIPVLPADASPGPVLIGAALLGAAMTFVEMRLRRLLD